MIFVPLTTGMLRISGQRFVRSVTVAVTDLTRMDAIQTAMTTLLTERHSGTQDFQVRNMADVIETATNKDTIKDFSTLDGDKIEIDHNVFTAFAGDPVGALSGTEFFAGTAATNGFQHIIYNQATGAVYYDKDGLGGTAQVQIALLSTKPVLDASDFILI